jgi:type VI secretion system protein
MALRLRVVSEHRRSLGERSTIVFGVGGGTIGRAADNDWVLPDSRRYLSSRHARVRFREGQFVLEDLSTNGVFVNDAERPVGRMHEHALRDGDLVRLGEYEILVTVDAATDFPPDRSAVVAIDALGASGGDLATTAGDIGASLNVEALLAPDTSLSDSFRAVNAFGQPVPTPYTRSRADGDIDRQAEAVSRRIAKLAQAVRAREAASPAAVYDVQTGLAAFCRGAGIEPETLPAEAQTRMLHLAGQLLREALVGMRAVERMRHAQHNRFRIPEESTTRDSPFSLASGDVNELLVNLLRSHDSRRLDAVQWLRGQYSGTSRHEEALVRAMRAAFEEFIDRLDPDELQARFERALKRGPLQGDARAQYWDLYADFYRNVTEMPADHLPHVFVEAFARAYLDAVRPNEEP